MMQALGAQLRKQRRRLGLTLDELAIRTGISKPYLSLIETARVKNAPSDAKILRLEETLGFAPGELLGQAHLQRTPRDVRAMLHKLLAAAKGNGDAALLDEACLAGFLREFVDPAGGNVNPVTARSIPLLNRPGSSPRHLADAPSSASDTQITGCPDMNDPRAFAVRVVGDCMMPKYHDGDVVIFSPALLPRPGDDCFVRFHDGQTTFARIFFESADGHPVLRLKPRNERYASHLTATDKVVAVYRAVYRYQRVDEEQRSSNTAK